MDKRRQFHVRRGRRFSGYCRRLRDREPSVDRKQVGKILQRLTKITGNNVGVIELAEDLDIETVTEIFIR